ncbi:MAG: PRC-barrel domain-containing protein [Candidatus Kapabacteria bacterium]|jgi:sporulation protein YlmC with PRC-barrel domain|nr:PRC-barrel domain-containing protein [Candidatus Kapabacteria bacterium]
MSDNNKNLYYLDELSDYQVASDYCDVIGWEVIDANNRAIGKVDRLLVNKKTERVVYLDVEVDTTLIEDEHNTYQVPVSEGVHEFLNEDGEDHLIIPIGMASLDEENERVLTNQIDYSTFAKTSRFKKGTDINSEYELKVLRQYSGDNAIDNDTYDDRFYDRKEFENYWNRKEDK